MSEPGRAQELQEERKAPGKSPKEGEESGDLSPLSPDEPRPERVAWPWLERHETLREMALHSKMSRLAEATSRLVQVEQTLLFPLLQQHPFSLHAKASKRETEVHSFQAFGRRAVHCTHNCTCWVLPCGLEEFHLH